MLFSSVFIITEMRDMGLYEVPLSMSLLGFGMGTMLANFHMSGIMFFLRAVLNMFVMNASPRGPICLRYLMYVHVNCFVVRGCAVSRRCIHVCNSYVFSVVNMYHDHLKFGVVCINGML